MALYSEVLYAIHLEFILGYLTMFVACLALICALPSYSSCMLRPDDLGKDIDSLCFWTCLSILPGGTEVVTSYASMVPGYAGSFRYDGVTGVDRRW